MQIELNLKRVLILAGVVLLLGLGFAIYHTQTRNAYEARIVELQNDVASRDKTIETQKGVYERLSIQSQNLTELLGDKDRELVLLKKQLDDQGAEILTANKLIVKLRKDLEHRADVPAQPVPPGHDTFERMFPIDSKDDLLPFRVTGWVTAKPKMNCDPLTVSVGLNLTQVRPLNVSVLVSQDSDGSWRAHATSSEEAFEIDIALSGVNPRMLERKWYEKIGLGADIGIGTNPGFLVGLGAYYEIGRFEVGPRVWMVVDRGASAYFGAQLLWHPFAK